MVHSSTAVGYATSFSTRFAQPLAERWLAVVPPGPPVPLLADHPRRQEAQTQARSRAHVRAAPYCSGKRW